MEYVRDDIEITHAGGQTVVRGADRAEVKALRDRVKDNTAGNGSLIFRGVQKIDVLKPGSLEPQQTIFGEPGEGAGVASK